jgi:NADH-quinone oxidoreductase subunit J
VALVLALILGTGVVIAFGNQKIKPVSAGSAADVGTAVFHVWVLPFEVLSVLLLAALIGAIVLSQRSGKLSEPSDTVSSSDDSAQKGEV